MNLYSGTRKQRCTLCKIANYQNATPRHQPFHHFIYEISSTLSCDAIFWLFTFLFDAVHWTANTKKTLSSLRFFYSTKCPSWPNIVKPLVINNLQTMGLFAVVVRQRNEIACWLWAAYKRNHNNKIKGIRAGFCASTVQFRLNERNSNKGVKFAVFFGYFLFWEQLPRHCVNVLCWIVYVLVHRLPHQIHYFVRIFILFSSSPNFSRQFLLFQFQLLFCLLMEQIFANLALVITEKTGTNKHT